MPYSLSNLPDQIKHKPKHQQEAFIAAFNDSHSKGRSEEESWIAGLGAMKRVAGKKVKKSVTPVSTPSHLPMEVLKQSLEKEESKKLLLPAFLRQHSLPDNINRNLIAVNFDTENCLVLTFDTGEIIKTSPVEVGDTINQTIGLTTVNEAPSNLNLDYIDFSLTPSVTAEGFVGRLVWNPTQQTLDLGMDTGEVTQSIGLETYYRVMNQTGSTILDGTCVMHIGSVGNSGQVKVSPALVGVNDRPEAVLGLATHNIENGTVGFITHFGLVNHIDTTGSSVGETWLDGDIVYVHPTQAGKLTKVPPAAPTPKITVGMVVKAHTNGQIFVRPSYGASMTRMNDVLLTSPANTHSLVYDGTKWINKAPYTVVNLSGTSQVIPNPTGKRYPRVRCYSGDALVSPASISVNLTNITITNLMDMTGWVAVIE